MTKFIEAQADQIPTGEFLTPGKRQQLIEVFDPRYNPNTMLLPRVDGSLMIGYVFEQEFIPVDVRNRNSLHLAEDRGFHIEICPTSEGGRSGKEPSVKRALEQFRSTQPRERLPKGLFLDMGQDQLVSATQIVNQNGDLQIVTVTVWEPIQKRSGSFARLLGRHTTHDDEGSRVIPTNISCEPVQSAYHF